MLSIADRSIQLMRPAVPDLFLDDEQLQTENDRNDYMPYWAFLWPSAEKMAAMLLQHAEWPIGTELLELGAGIGLVGLAALLRGDRVTFSDYDPTALHLCRLNARLNGCADPDLLLLDWRDAVDRQFPVIIGCEVTYDAATHGVLLETLQKMLAPGGVCWLGDPGRYQAPFFARLAEERGFALEWRDASGQPGNPESILGFQLLRLVRR
ncbi:class I SAM-dependent methyltransferase [Planctomicrobium sp. SH664]|uniref:class I SAM-dependent methyltransferase n=1 Tax=Planctomicrobium sp. SH664 TaxID=3448125 RepID=UPI003F5B9420